MRSRLDEETKRRIYELYQQGIRPTDIATMLGVSLMQVYYWGDPEWRKRHRERTLENAREWYRKNHRKLALKRLLMRVKRTLKEYVSDEAWQAVRVSLLTYAKAAKDTELEEVLLEA